MAEKVYEQRPYQIECVATVFNELQSKINRQLVVMATGLGKTFTALRISEQFKRILFVAHREELIDQAFNVFEAWYPLQVGIVKGTRCDTTNKIVIGSVQTLTNRLGKFNPADFDLVIIDEMHHYMAPSYIKVAQFFTPTLLLGLTATPHRLDGLSLGNLIDKIVYDYGIDKGIKDGWLCELDAFRIRTGTDISKIKRTGGDFAKTELSVAVNSAVRNKLIVAKYKEYCEGRQALVFAVDQQHAKDICAIFKESGYNADVVVSDEDITPERSKTVREFREGKIQILVNVMILTEGFDHCNIGAILMARPTESLTVYIQQIGRGTRRKDEQFIFNHGRNNCIILDFVDGSGKHKLINTWTLDEGKRIEDMTFIGEERKKQLIAKREFKLAQERKMRIKEGEDRRINLLSLPIIRIRKDKGKFLEMATEKQIAWLKSEGVFVEGATYTKGQASEFITNFPAQDWMIVQLRVWGYDISGNVTIGQYYEVKKNREEAMPATKEPMTKEPKNSPFSS
jgi:superfamily II DNA or RNA helicase